MTTGYRNSATASDAVEVNWYHGGIESYPRDDSELHPLGGQSLEVRSLTLTTSDLTLKHLQVSGANARRGLAAPGRSFGYTNLTGAPNRWCGHTDEGKSILAFASEFEATSAAGFDGVRAAFSDSLLASTRELLEYRQTPPTSASIMDVDVTSLGSIREIVTKLEGIGGNLFNVDSAKINELTHDLCRKFVVATGSFQGKRPRLNARRKAFERACRFINDNAGERLTLEDICRSSHASARTLEYAFKEFSGTTPMAHLKRRRLQGVFKDLENRGAAGETIGAIANRWGFWHMGQFAADFKRAYGLRPREVSSLERRQRVIPKAHRQR